ncbi:MAG: hypothetical protein HYU70_07235 [Bacteroidetes bacterium]|nr:hypothetical protein [Bacteroidota bacterium]
MIKEYEYLHGVVFTRLCSVSQREISIRPFKDVGYSSYVINNAAGLYIKYSGKRLSPWRFTVKKTHQDEIVELYNSFGEVFIALVCHLDGVVILSYSELKKILNKIHDENEWISVARKKNKMYTVCASNGDLKYKIGLQSCPDKIMDHLAKRASS